MKYSSCRETRIITGRPIFFAMSAGMRHQRIGAALRAEAAAAELGDVNEIRGLDADRGARCPGTGKLWLCVEPYRKHLPFCQYASALRGSIE